LQQFLKQYRGLQVLAPVKVNQPPVRSQPAQQQLNRLRLTCETVNAQLQEQLHLSKHYAKSTQGLMTRIAAKVTAHSVGMMINALFGRPMLKLAELAV
jgi:flagellar biosynthesis chaperone FliJ